MNGNSLDFPAVNCFICGGASQGKFMQAATLMVVYVLTMIAVQFIGFGISQAVTTQEPALGLMTFLTLFLAAFGIAWPIAVRITEWLIRHSGGVVETEQSGGASNRDHYRRT